MLGSLSDFIRRMLQVLPPGWFADDAPTLGAVLAGFATAWQSAWQLLQTVQAQARIATATGTFLDLISADYFGSSLPRWPNEADAHFKLRIQQEMLKPRATRAAIAQTLLNLTGRAPQIFEPVRPADTGSYNAGGAGYAIAGGWGNLACRNMSFITAWRPKGAGIAYLAGYNTGGYLAYGDLSMVATQVTDSDIQSALVAVLPAGHIAWLRITG